MAEEEGNSRRMSSAMEAHHHMAKGERDRERGGGGGGGGIDDHQPGGQRWARGPRSLFLKRSENGFGFTLRHFIVYPPESYTVLSRDRCLGLRGGDWDEPMDTIFVKHVRPSSPASQAGLANGDRIVSVNGETIGGKSYAHVVQLIHQSPAYLHLLVVPKEDDILQLYFGETAHNPETNPRPRLKSPEMVSSGVGGELRQGGVGQGSPVTGTTHHSRLSAHREQLQHHQSVPPLASSTPYHGNNNMWDDAMRFHSPQRLSSGTLSSSLSSGRRASEGSRGIMPPGSAASLLQPSTALMSVGSGSDRYCSSESMPSAMSDTNLPGCRLSLDAGLMAGGGESGSHSHDSSVSSLDSAARDLHSSDDSLIINRIRKSFEQKEEFLKRPAAPIWAGPGGPEREREPIPQREFYARPQKLQPPVWPPAIPASSVVHHHSPVRKQSSADDLPPGGFICGGPVTNVPNQDLSRGGGGGSRNRSTFVSTLGRIQENGKAIADAPPQSAAAATSPVPLSRLAIVSQRARQFEMGAHVDPELPDRTSLYKSELARLSEKRNVPNVAVRKREFEAKSDGRRGFINRESRSLDSAVPVPMAVAPQTPMSAPPPSALSGNRTIPVGGLKLHCEPPVEGEPADMLTASYPSQKTHLIDETELSGSGRPRSNSAEAAWLGDEWPHRHKAVRQDSYLAACRKPVLRTPEPDQRDEDEEERQSDVKKKKKTKKMKKSAAKKEERKSMSDAVECFAAREVPAERVKPVRPNRLDIPNPIRPLSSFVFPQNTPSSPERSADEFERHTFISEAFQDDTSEDKDVLNPLRSPNLSASPGSRPANRANEGQQSPGGEDDKAQQRRVSYLKATWNDRMNVDSEPELSDSETPLHHQPLPHSPSAAAAVIQSSVQPVATPATGAGGARSSICVSEIGDKDGDQNVVKEGSLNCKLTLVDGKRAGDRSWKQVWAVLRGPILYLFRERRDSLPNTETPLGSDATSVEHVDMRCALVAAADNYTKRKHVLRLNTLSGSELLLQAEDASHMAHWILTLQEQANNNNPENLTGSSLSPVAAHKGIKKLTSFRNRSPTGQSPVNKTRKPSHSVEGQQTQPASSHQPQIVAQASQPPAQQAQLPSPKTKTWKGRVAKQFRRIGQGAGSPVSPTAPETHLEGATIGIPLEDCPPSSESKFVPLLVEMCTGIVEARGLEIIGIYRVPGNTAAVSSLTEAVNRGLDPLILDQDPRWSDVNVISSLLKSFFRRLPDSLLTSDLYPLFIQADKIENPLLRIATIRKLVHELPDHHYETLRYLMQHLKRVVDHCSVNKMEARNLAIVFGPTLIRTVDDNMVTMVTDMSHQCRIVESLILHVDWCFSDDDIDQLDLTVANESGAGRSGSQPDNDVALLNHNLLLGNIHKVEGMKSSSSSSSDFAAQSAANKEISAKDIVSSIICAANRKMHKSKSRSKNSTSSSTLDGDHLQSTSSSALHDIKQGSVAMRQRLMDTKAKALNRKERVTSASDDLVSDQTSRLAACGKLLPTVASSIRESVLFSGSIADKLTAGNEAAGGGESPTGAGDEKDKVLGDLHSVVDEDGTIRTYAGLSETTQERIRRFELETKAMLTRDSSRNRMSSSSEGKQGLFGLWEKDRERLDRDGQQAKRELESDDAIDSMADNPSAIGKKIAEEGDGRRTADRSPQARIAGCGAADADGNAPGSVPMMNLKRLKTGREQLQKSDQFGGSSDSLNDNNSGGRPNSQPLSDEGGDDLLTSLTSTFDAKMRSLLSTSPECSGDGCRSPTSSTHSQLAETPSSNENSNNLSPATTPTDDVVTMTTTTVTRSNKEERSGNGKATEYRDPSLHRASSVSGRSADAGKENATKDGARNCDGKSGCDRSKQKKCGSSEAEEAASSRGDEKADDNLDTKDPISNKENIIGDEPSANKLSSCLKNGGDDTGTMNNNNNNASDKASMNLRRSESLNKRDAEKHLDVCKLRRSESLNKNAEAATANKLKRSDSLNRSSETKLKRSDSLTKTEKTESNLNKRRQLEAGRWSHIAKLKRKNGVLSGRSIKRRHTVGGTKDFDKVHWLDNRQREAEQDSSRKERRTSSPDLSSSRLTGILVEVVLRPHSLQTTDPNLASRLFNVPLESHV